MVKIIIAPGKKLMSFINGSKTDFTNKKKDATTGALSPV
jgi:hypothetical protein